MRRFRKAYMTASAYHFGEYTTQALQVTSPAPPDKTERVPAEGMPVEQHPQRPPVHAFVKSALTFHILLRFWLYLHESIHGKGNYMATIQACITSWSK